jgi:hypothetical protein
MVSLPFRRHRQEDRDFQASCQDPVSRKTKTKGLGHSSSGRVLALGSVPITEQKRNVSHS